MVETLRRTRGHAGTSFVEILQNCIVYNGDVFQDVTDRKGAADSRVHVRHGAPLLFGGDNSRGLRLNPAAPSLEAVTIGEGGVTADDILVHDETSVALAGLLAGLDGPDVPAVLGVI